MATLPKAGAVTLLDFAKSINPDGSIAAVAELLNQTNEILTDMLWVEGNLPTGHQSTIRTGLPSVVWRQMYKGVPAGKSQRAQVTDTCGMLEARSEVDKAIAELNGVTAEFRLSEADAFLEAMNQAFCQTLFYGDTTVNPERFYGLAPRYSSLSAGNATNIIDAGGAASDNTSVWLIVWNENTVSGIFPKGSQAGLEHTDLGLIDAFDGQTPAARYRAYADHWVWRCGLTVKDWRYAVRIANVKIADLTGQTGTQAITASTWIVNLMVKAMARIPAMGRGKAAFYANRTVKEMLSIMAMNKASNVLSIQEGLNQLGSVTPGSVGNGVLKLLGVPIRTCDQILSTETRVV
jgi:hypothetical protein